MEFRSWSGSCTGNGPCVVTVDGNESVTATFVEGANTLDVTVVGNGTVIKSPDQVTYPNGASVSLTATPVRAGIYWLEWRYNQPR